jgi:hypothetical protein
MKIRPMGTEFFREDGRTDGQRVQVVMTKLIISFRNFVNAPKINWDDKKNV